MLKVTVFVDDPEGQTVQEALAVSRARAAVARFPEQVSFSVQELAGDDALAIGAVVSPTIVVGDTAISMGEPPLAGRIKRFIEAALGESA